MPLVIFDLDDTLLAGDSEGAWANFMLKQGIVKEINFEQQLSNFEIEYRKGTLNINAYLNLLMEPLIRRPVKEVKELANTFASQVVKDLTDSITRELLEAHKYDTCLIVSGTLDFLVNEISLLLGIKESISTKAEIQGNTFTGKIVGSPNFGEQKVLNTKAWLSRNKWVISEKIFAYSDSIFDLPLLEFSNIPCAVSPDNKLRKVAKNKGWKILERN